MVVIVVVKNKKGLTAYAYSRMLIGIAKKRKREEKKNFMSSKLFMDIGYTHNGKFHILHHLPSEGIYDLKMAWGYIQALKKLQASDRLEIRTQNPESFDDYDSEFRVCTQCGLVFQEGYCYGDGEDYYCSDECLQQHLSIPDGELESTIQTLYDNDSLYWSTWDESGDAN